jgi:hypothetical protein
MPTGFGVTGGEYNVVNKVRQEDFIGNAYRLRYKPDIVTALREVKSLRKGERQSAPQAGFYRFGTANAVGSISDGIGNDTGTGYVAGLTHQIKKRLVFLGKKWQKIAFFPEFTGSA